MGAGGGILGRTSSNALASSRNLPSKGPKGVFTKEELGEDFSKLRTRVRGDRTKEVSKSRQYLQDGKHTYVDSRSYRGAPTSPDRELIESKAGMTARLSDRQREARAQFPNYRVDHALPRDAGVVFGFPAAMAGYQTSIRAANGWPQDPW